MFCCSHSYPPSTTFCCFIPSLSGLVLMPSLPVRTNQIIWKDLTILTLHRRSGILTTQQPHRITSGAITNSKLFYASAKHVTKSQVCLVHCNNVKNLSIYQCRITHDSVRPKPVSILFLGTYWYPVGIHYGNPLESLLTMGWVAYFIPPAHKRNCVNYNTV